MGTSAARQVGYLVATDVRTIEMGFMRDAHPNREALIWECIADTCDAYLSEHPRADKRKVVAILAGASISRPASQDRRIARAFTAVSRCVDGNWERSGSLRDNNALVEFRYRTGRLDDVPVSPRKAGHHGDDLQAAGTAADPRGGRDRHLSRQAVREVDERQDGQHATCPVERRGRQDRL